MMVEGRERSPSLVVTVVEALADAEGGDPMDLDFVLNDYLDPDAIEALNERSETDWKLQFSVAGRTVTVDNGERIAVDGTEYRHDPFEDR